MNEPWPDQFEQDLQRLRPAPPSAEVMERLAAARPTRMRAVLPAARPHQASLWPGLLRWLLPATAVLVVALVVWRGPLSPVHETSRPHAALMAAPLKADDVEIQQELVRSFDTVALLPGGEPVRFRCSEWLDEVTVRDKRGGLVIEQRSPRVEVVPVRFETY